jgi:hypothetical protein
MAVRALVKFSGAGCLDEGKAGSFMHEPAVFDI